MKFLLVFFRADDAPPELLDQFLSWLSDGSGPPTGELASYYDELARDFSASNRDARGFRLALESMCTCMRTEKHTDKATMTEDEFRRLRKHTVGVPAYTECWRTIRGVAFSPRLEEAIADVRLLFRAAEIVYLVNDIGSLDRDLQSDPATVDPNIVMLRIRAHGDRDLALTEAIRAENEQIADFQNAERLLLTSEHGEDPALHAYLDILRSTINGNLAAMKHLIPVRYPDAALALDAIRLA